MLPVRIPPTRHLQYTPLGVLDLSLKLATTDKPHSQDLPELARGKGNKLINIPAAKAKLREEHVVDVQVIGADDSLTIWSGKRHFTLKKADRLHYQNERGRRGNRLPRGLQNVTALLVTRN